MTNLQQFLRLRTSMILFVIAAGLISRPTLAHAQFADQSQCSSQVVDYEDDGYDGGSSNDVEQSACFYYDNQTGFDSWVETDNDYYESFYSEYGYDNEVTWAVGAEAQLFYLDSNGDTITLADSGMNTGEPSAYAVASSIEPAQPYVYILNCGFSEEDQYNNWSGSSWGMSLEIDFRPIPNLTVGTSGTPSDVGQPVTFTAILPFDATGENVDFFTDGGYIGSGTFSGSTATLTTSALSIGTYTIAANYYGDSNYGAATSSITQIVVLSGAPPTLGLTTSGTPSTAGQPVTFTATISPNGPTGTVSFSVDGTVIGSGTINGNTATVTTTALATGTHLITASYSGDSNYSAASSNTIAQAVTAWIPPPAAIYSYSIPTPATQFTGYMPNGNVLGYTDSVMGPWNFYYDSLNRITGAEAGLGPYQGLQMSWSYDSFGNRLTQTNGGDMNIWTQSGNDANGNPHNQVTGTNARGVSWTPDYDAAGNMLDDGANQYLYDADGHVCAVRNMTYGGMTGYLYNASGTRVAKGTITSLSCDPTSNGFTTSGTPYTQYYLGPNGEQMTEMAVSGGTSTWVHTNAYAGGVIATYLNDGVSPHFRFADWLGTTRAQTNSAGTLELTCQNLPFGDTSTQCAPATEQFFTGKERDAESGNDYFGARYYASSMGRFLSPDWSAQAEPVPYAKLDNPQSLNLYSYMYNSPLGGVDADGHWPGWLDNGVADTRQWAAEHPRTMEAAAAVATGVATVGAVALIVATAPVSVPATLGAAAITALTTTTAVIGATGGAVATVTLAAGAISGDVKGTSAAATAVGTVTNPVGMAVALGTGGNMQAAGTAATATSLVTGLQSAATGANALIQAGGAASAASAASGLAPAPTPAPARTPAPTPCSTDTSQCH